MKQYIHVARSAAVLVAALLSSRLAWGQATEVPSGDPGMMGEDDVVVLSPFEVTTDDESGYVATETLAGTRIRTDLRDVGGAISVVTREFLTDIGATDNSTLLQYTPNAEVAGTRGTYTGLGNGTSVDETTTLRAPMIAQRVRGLASADNTRDFFVTDIPWDSYNVDRIDIQRGPNSILFGLGSPAGIINAQTRNAGFTTGGDLQARFGSYGSWRASLDYNYVVAEDELAVRFAALHDREEFKQDPAFENDERYYGAVRWDPRWFKNDGMRTSIKVKYEHGDIEANRPRIVPPSDSITPWFRPVDTTSMNGGMGKLTVPVAYGVGSNAAALNPWLTSGAIANQQQPIWFMDGATGDQMRIYSGHINTGARDNNGANRGPSNSLLGQTYSDQFYGLNSLAGYAVTARLPNSQYGQYRQASLLDDSVFDFQDVLIDGPTKGEFENWDAYNIDVSQTAFEDRLAFQLSYDRQKYKRGGQALLGNPTINIDVLETFQDLNANPNFGRPYVVGGPGGGSSYESDREYWRASLFAELRAADLFENSFLVKLLGRHRFNGVYADESYWAENRSWQMYANSQTWDGYWNQNSGGNHDFKDRPPVGIIYLGGSVASRDSASGARIPGIGAPVQLQDGGVYHFASTWTAPGSVAFDAPWDVPANLFPMFDGAPEINPATGEPFAQLTQASNPANYVGWNSNFAMNLLRSDMGSNPDLLRTASQSLRETESYVGSWQGYFWNDSIIPTLGWRYDRVITRGATARPVTSNRSMLNLSASGDNPYVLPDGPGGAANQGYAQFKDHSTAGGVVVHLNRLIGERDFLPVNVSLSYNKSNNFQVTDARRNIYGQLIDNPSGKTKDYGVVLSTKDNKYSFRAVKYETSVSNASIPSNIAQLVGNPVQQGLRFRNVFLYRLSVYTWDTREQGYDAATNSFVNDNGRRYWWHPAYLDANGRPVASFQTTTPPAGATLQTAEEAKAHGDASIRAWNDIQRWLDDRGYFQAWGYTPLNEAALTDRSTYEATLGPNTTDEGNPPRAIPVQNNAALVPDQSTLFAYTAAAPQGLTMTADTVSEGYEFEFVANPVPNWRLAINASKTTAVRNNVGDAALAEFIAFMDEQMAGVAGDMRQFNGDYSAANEVRTNWANQRANYTQLTLLQGAAAPEIRPWRFNVVTNYTFTSGFLNNVGIGGSYRWQDKVIIGYPVIPDPDNPALGSFDLSRPYHGPSEGALDLWASYERPINDKITWRVQLNIRNAFDDEGLIPISVQPDGETWASVRVKPTQEWFITNTFSF